MRLKHEEEVKRLEQQNTRVQLTMEEQLAETKENARTVIEQYEDRLAELNRLVIELRQEKLMSVQSRLEAKDTIRMLEAVKEVAVRFMMSLFHYLVFSKDMILG